MNADLLKASKLNTGDVAAVSPNAKVRVYDTSEVPSLSLVSAVCSWGSVGMHRNSGDQ